MMGQWDGGSTEFSIERWPESRAVYYDCGSILMPVDEQVRCRAGKASQIGRYICPSGSQMNINRRP